MDWNAIWTWITQYAASFVLQLIGALLIIIIGFKVIKIITKALRKAKSFSKFDTSATTFLISAISIVLKLIVILSAVAILGVDMTSIVALLGTAGLAVGLALQGSFTNLAGGLMLLMFKPFKVGDFIQTSSQMGTVEEIGVFYTVITSIDNRKITIPNGTLSNATVENYSAKDIRRADLEYSVAYESNIDQVKEILLKTAQSHPLVLKEPAVYVGLKQHADSALVFVCRPYCKSGDYWTVFFDLNEQIKKEFDKAGISIPFPQVDVHTK